MHPKPMTSCCRLLRNSILLSFFLTIFFCQYSWAQSCNGLAGGLGGGLNKTAPGDICSNSAVAPGQMKIDLSNVDDLGDFTHVSFQVDWNDGTTQNLIPTALDYNAVTHGYTLNTSHFFPGNGANVKCTYIPTVT